MVLKLTKKQLDCLLEGKKKNLVKEDQESKAMQTGINYLISKGYDRDKAKEIFNSIRTNIPSVRLPLYTNNNGREKGSYKFIIGVERMYLNRELESGSVIQRLNQTLKLAASDAHVNEYNNDLNGLSAEELINRFSGAVANNLEKDRQNVGSKQYNNSNGYKVVKIPSFEEAEKYGQYTSWCVTHYENMYDSYTNNGTGLFYFFLKDGFEKVQKIKGENCPLDEYGLSMIAVSVNDDGSINTVTCRWNRDNGGNDNIMDAKQLSEVVGMNVYEVCKPYTEEELVERGIFTVSYVNKKLAEGVPLATIHRSFKRNYGGNEHYDIIEYSNGGKYVGSNLYSIEDNELVFSQWCLQIVPKDRNILLVRIQDYKECLFDIDNGNVITDNYYQSIYDYEQYAKTAIVDIGNGKSNILSVKKNRLLLSRNVSGIFYLSYYFFLIKLDYNKLNIYNAGRDEYLFKKDAYGFTYTKNGAEFYFSDGSVAEFDYKTHKAYWIKQPNTSDYNLNEGKNKYMTTNSNDGKNNITLREKFDQICETTIWNEKEEELINEWYNNLTLTDEEYMANVCKLGESKKKICFGNNSDDALYESILKEDQESKAMQAGINYLVSKGYDQNRAREIFNAIRNDIPSVRLPLYTNNNGREKGTYKFIIGVERMFLDNELSEGSTIQRLNQTLKLLASDAHVNEYNNDLNGMSAEELINRFSGVMSNNLEKDKQEVGSVQYSNNKGYNVVRINSFEEAEKYGQYTSWCVTHYENMYDSYTNNGTGLFYFFLKNGFEAMKPIQGKGCPLDEYGLSMIAVSINDDGSINTVTCRWNHDNGGNDNIMDAKQLSEVVGMNVYEVCKPKSGEELFKEGHLTPNYVNEMLRAGKTLNDLYIIVDVDLDDDHSIVYYTQQKNNDNVFNVYSRKSNRLLSKQWCYDVIETDNPSVVKLMLKKYGLIDLDRDFLVGNQYFDYIVKTQCANKDLFLVITNHGTNLLSVSKNKLIVNGNYNYINKTNVDNYYLVQDDETDKYNLFDCMNERFVFNEWCVSDENKHLRINNTHVYHFYSNSNDVYVSIGNSDGKVDFITKEEYETLYNKVVSNNSFPYNESKKHNIIEKSSKKLKNVLNEDQESKAMQTGINYLISKGYDQNRAREIFNAIRNDIPSVRLPLYTNNNGREKGTYKFAIGVERMYLNGELSDGNTVQRLNQTLKLLASDAHVNEYNNDLNGMSAEELINRFSGVVANNLEKDKQDVSSRKYDNSNGYKVVKIPSFEEASKYRQYTSWCITRYEDMYNSYTNNGTGLFYFFLKDGFENVQQIMGENCPLDEYGLSMIAVSINVDGSLNTVTCRWNHDNGGNDNIMDAKQLSEVVGMNVYEVCKPYSDEEFFKKGILTVSYANKMLKEGKTFDEIGLFTVENIDDSNILVEHKHGNEEEPSCNIYSTKQNRLIVNMWFSNVTEVENNPLYVIIWIKGGWSVDDKEGLVDLKSGQLVTNRYYWSISPFQSKNRDLFMVSISEKEGDNFLSVSKNKLLFDKDVRMYIDSTNHPMNGQYYLLRLYKNGNYGTIFDCLSEKILFDWAEISQYDYDNSTYRLYVFSSNNGKNLMFFRWDMCSYYGKDNSGFISNEEGWTLLKQMGVMSEGTSVNNKTFYLTESQYQYIKENLSSVDTNKVLVVKKYLDNNFVRGNIPTIDNSGYPKSLLIVGMKGTDGNVAKNMSAQQLLDLLEDKFQKIYGDKNKRNRFLKQVMIDWYNKKISKEGLLSVSRY